MGTFRPALDDYGEHGQLRVSFALWVVFGLLTRHFWISAGVIASAAKVPESALLLAGFSWWPLLIEMPALLTIAASFRRRPEAGKLPRLLWRYGREILTAVAVLQLVYMAWRWSTVDLFDIFWSFVDAGLAVATLGAIFWLWTSRYVRTLFAEFPAPAAPASTPSAQAAPVAAPGAAVIPATHGRPTDDGPLSTRTNESAAKLQRVLELFRQEQFAEAELVCRELLDENRNDPDALHLMGIMRHYLGDNAAAELLIGRAITLVPDFVPFYVNLAAIYRALGRAQDAARLDERIGALSAQGNRSVSEQVAGRRQLPG